MDNKTATALKATGIAIMVLGVIGGIALGNQFKVVTGRYYTYEEFNTALMIASWVASFLAGIFFLALGVIIEQLEAANTINAACKQQLQLLVKQMEQAPEEPKKVEKAEELPSL